jgi:hypothetical protein
MSMNKSYESIFLKSERRKSNASLSLNSTWIPGYKSSPEARNSVSRDTAAVDVSSGSQRQRSRSKSPLHVSFEDAIEPPVPEPPIDGDQPKPFRSTRPSKSRPRALNESSVLPVSAEPERQIGPTDRRAPSASPARIALTDVDWVGALQPRPLVALSQKTKKLSEILKHVPLSVKGADCKLAANGFYITEIDTIPRDNSMSVTTLYLSNNSLSALLGVEQFQNVRVASFTNNTIRYLRDLAPLYRLVNLEKLSLDGNPVVSMPYYRPFLLSFCPGLVVLDGVRVTDEERAAVDVLSRKGAAIMEQLRTNEMRSAVLRHLCSLAAMHSELTSVINGRFRYA